MLYDIGVHRLSISFQLNDYKKSNQIKSSTKLIPDNGRPSKVMQKSFLMHVVLRFYAEMLRKSTRLKKLSTIFVHSKNKIWQITNVKNSEAKNLSIDQFFS